MRILHRGWQGLCVLAVAGLIGGRLLRSLWVAPPPPVDFALGGLMIAESQLFLWPWVITGALVRELASLAPFGAPGLLALVALALVLLRRRLFRRGDGGWGLSPLAVSLLCAAMLWLQFLFDANPFIATLCVTSLAAALLARLAPPGRAARVLATALFVSVWLLLAPDAADRITVLVWSAAAIFAAVFLSRFVAARDLALLGVLGILPANLLPSALPLVLPLHDGEFLGEGLAYGFCESPEHGTLFASVPACSSVNYETERYPSHCPEGRVVAYDRDTLERTASHAFFSERFHGRLEQLVCAGDEVHVAVQGTLRDGHEDVHTVLSFPIESPGDFTAVVAGPRMGSALAYDARRHAVFYVSEFSHRIVRNDLTRGVLRDHLDPSLARSWVHPFWKEELTGSWSRMSIDPEADRLYLAEWFHGRRAYALDLATLAIEARYEVNGGGSWGVSADGRAGRLLVAGIWGVAVVDLASGKVIARRRLGLGTKEPVIDVARNRLYVTSVVEGKLRVLDRDSLELVAQVPIGFGTRHPYLSLDGSRLFASSLAAHYTWRPDALVPSR